MDFVYSGYSFTELMHIIRESEKRRGSMPYSNYLNYIPQYTDCQVAKERNHQSSEPIKVVKRATFYRINQQSSKFQQYFSALTLSMI
jgi:endonuclease I